MGYIYKITNTVNSKSYIGISIYDPEKRRIKEHLNGRGSKYLSKSVKKYGKESFSYEIIEQNIFPELLPELEIYHIKKHNTIRPHGYNLTEGGEGALGYKHTEESLLKMSQARKKRVISDETRRRTSESLKGRIVSDETRKKISKSNKGKHNNLSGDKNYFFGKTHSEITRKKISDSQKGRIISSEHRQKISNFMKGNTYNLGRKLSEKHIQKLIEVNTGSKHSENAKRKMSESRTSPYKKRDSQLLSFFTSKSSSIRKAKPSS